MKIAMRTAAAVGLLLSMAACGGNQDEPETSETTEAAFAKNPYPSTYEPYPSGTILCKGVSTSNL